MQIFNILTHKDRVIIKNMSPNNDDLAYPDGVYQNILYTPKYYVSIQYMDI
jgi:hypothetical protein